MHPRAGFSKPPWDRPSKEPNWGSLPNHARAKAALSSTVWFELGVTFPRIRLGVALRRLVLRLPCAEPTTPTHLGEGATHGTHFPVTNPADRTAKKDPLNSRLPGTQRWMARAVRRRVKETSSWRREVPSGSVVLRGARNKSLIAVAACLRSARRGIAALHPKPAHDATPVANTAHRHILNFPSARMGRESEKNSVRSDGLT